MVKLKPGVHHCSTQVNSSARPRVLPDQIQDMPGRNVWSIAAMCRPQSQEREMPLRKTVVNSWLPNSPDVPSRLHAMLANHLWFYDLPVCGIANG